MNINFNFNIVVIIIFIIGCLTLIFLTLKIHMLCFKKFTGNKLLSKWWN